MIIRKSVFIYKMCFFFYINCTRCRGTVALVHTECLERWLTESGHTRCELCGYKYLVKRVPRHGLFRSVWIWFNTVVATRQVINLYSTNYPATFFPFIFIIFPSNVLFYFFLNLLFIFFYLM